MVILPGDHVAKKILCPTAAWGKLSGEYGEM